MDEAPGGDAEAGGDAGGPALGRAPGDHIGHVGAGGEIGGEGGRQERRQLGQIEHGTPLGRLVDPLGADVLNSPANEAGKDGPGEKWPINASICSTARCATAPRPRVSISARTTRRPLPRRWTGSASTMSRAAGRAPTRPTTPSFPSRRP